MTQKEAFELIGRRVEELVKLPQIQEQMVEIGRTRGKEAAVKLVYMTAIGTLIGLQK